MLKIEKTEVVGWEAAIRGMRNPMNSWEKSNSRFVYDYSSFDRFDDRYQDVEIGSNDHDLMMRLAKGGPVHAKYRRMIAVYVDITAPLYWWKEFDTYKVGTVANSCSTMHKIAAKEFTLEDFSCEHLSNFSSHPEKVLDPLSILKSTIVTLNSCRHEYLETKDKFFWWQMIQLLPSSYNQKRTVMLNYEVLAGIYPSRKDHKLDEWHVLCDWIVDLPYSELITGESTCHDGVCDITFDDTWPDPSTPKEEWPSTSEEIKEALEEWNKIVEKIRNANIKTLDDLKKELGIVSPSGNRPRIVDVSIMPDGTTEPRFAVDPEKPDEKKE